MKVTATALRSALIAIALALVILPGAALAANPPACATATYPSPFLIIDGTTNVAGNTRYISMRENPHSTDAPSHQAAPEHPFPLTVAPSNGASQTYTVNDYAVDQVPVTFAVGETIVVTATYVEVHGSQDDTGTHNTRCTRTVSANFNAPPRPKSNRTHRRHHRHHHHHHHGDQDQGQDEP